MSWNDLRKGRCSIGGGEYFITFNTENKKPIFYDFYIARLFCSLLGENECQHDCRWLTWVLMPDHFHGLLRLGEDSSLSKSVGGLKGATSFTINKALEQNGRLWQPSFYDSALRYDDDRESISRYIVANPLRKNLVTHIGDYPYWNSVYL
ncbi:hypothetical protein TUM4438_40630 [Shewanella sairae]|uniref:Transposase IS200-like domain-containing protein n=1 Tax=Shewanella sairae TaxID=190310 RepID=A0ABQ4PQE5_9GAMM|nr:transposase [Shewanella sairae]MCL1132308.1 transposase [Shewanella sairae]GIU51346.1 hypothetical protein TUM4438_40630 [Shewanella sairae]